MEGKKKLTNSGGNSFFRSRQHKTTNWTCTDTDIRNYVKILQDRELSRIERGMELRRQNAMC